MQPEADSGNTAGPLGVELQFGPPDGRGHRLESIPTRSPSAGRALEAPVRQRMETAFQTDFSDVRIHEGAQAPELGALAYTQGSHIHFAAGHYRPGAGFGQQVLAHELTHVLQQRQGRVGAGVDPDARLEAEAHQSGLRLAGGHSLAQGLASPLVSAAAPPAAAPSASGPIQRMQISFDFDHTKIPEDTPITRLHVTGEPPKPKPAKRDVTGAEKHSEFEVRHIDAWNNEVQAVRHQVEGQSIKTAATALGAGANVAALKKAIEDRLENFQKNPRNYFEGIKEPNNKYGPAASNALESASKIVKKAKIDQTASGKSDSDVEKDLLADSELAKQTAKASFFGFDVPPADEPKQKVKEAHRIRRRQRKRFPNNPHVQNLRSKHLINLPTAYREEYLGKRGKGVGGWQPPWIIRDEEIEKLPEDDVSDLDKSESEDELPQYK